MKNLKFCILLFFLLNICHGQSLIQVETKEWTFTGNGYWWKRQNIETGTIFMYDIMSNILYSCEIENSHFLLPCAVEKDGGKGGGKGEKFYRVALYYNGKYSCTKAFGLTTLVTKDPRWTFVIDEVALSNKKADIYYFALEVEPNECYVCGEADYKNRCLFHKRSKRMVRKWHKNAGQIHYLNPSDANSQTDQ